MAEDTFQEVLTRAIDDIVDHGFDSQERVERWMRELRAAAERSMASQTTIDQALRDALAQIYKRMVDQGGVTRHAPGVSRFTIEQVKPKLRAELDRRIMASANLIKLNRAESIDKTLRRFQGWATSIPAGGTEQAVKRQTKKAVRRGLSSLPFEERRVLIDQGHKLIQSISKIVAEDGGAIAGRWRSHWRQPGYDYREDHKERDEKVYAVRGCWALEQGLMKAGPAGYTDDITMPGEEVFCLPGDARIPFVDRADIAYRRWFDGELAEVVTHSGKTLRATPNHPVLTAQGWRPLGSLKEGDHVVEISYQGVDQSPIRDHNHAVPLISQIFCSFAKGGIAEVRGGRSDQFHGDGAEGNVDIIWATRPLSLDFVTERGRHSRRKFWLAVADHARAFVRSFDLLNHGRLATATSIMGGTSQPLSSDFAFFGHADSVRVAPSPRLTARCAYQINDHLAGYSAIDRKSQYAFAALMPRFQSGRVERARRIKFSGHVYNLQTASGWYVADGIITHNCRCYYVWIFSLRDLPADMLTRKGRDALAEARRKVEEMRADSVDAREPGQQLMDALFDASTLDRLDYRKGLKGVRVVPDKDEWHASYDPDREDIVAQAKLERAPQSEQIHVLLHEFGHRGQDSDAETYERFKEERLNDLPMFLDMANQAHLADFHKNGKPDSIAAEVFAESYARYMLDLDMPEPLRQFWAQREGRA